MSRHIKWIPTSGDPDGYRPSHHCRFIKISIVVNFSGTEVQPAGILLVSTVRTECGIPSVTLLGVKEDWQTLLERLEKLRILGNEPTQFYALLKPVLTRFVRMFNDPESDDIKDFWSRIAHESRGSGSHRISGWITAFSFWDQDGKSLYAPRGEPPTHQALLRLDETVYHTP